METIFQNSAGVQMEVFLRQYGERIKNKHVIYAVTTNLAEDRYISRSTRARLGGVNIKIGKSTGNPYARLKSYTNMASNYQAQFPQSGVRVLFVKVYPRRTEAQSGKPVVDIVETLLKRALRADNRLVVKRGSEIFNIDPQELFGLIESLEAGEYKYDERRGSERLGKRLLWMITDTMTGVLKLMYAADYDEVMRKFAESTDPSLMDDRSKYLTRYFIRPVNQPAVRGPVNVSSDVSAQTAQETTVEMPQGSMDSTPIRVTRGSRRRPRDEDDISSPPPSQRRGETIPTSGRVRGGAGLLDRFDAAEGAELERGAQRRRITATELRDAEHQPSHVPPQQNDMEIGLGYTGKRYRSLKEVYKDPRAENPTPQPRPPVFLERNTKRRPETIPTSGRKRGTYRENIERARASEGRVRDTTPYPGWSIRDID